MDREPTIGTNLSNKNPRGVGPGGFDFELKQRISSGLLLEPIGY
jgi:hypothetical protein